MRIHRIEQRATVQSITQKNGNPEGSVKSNRRIADGESVYNANGIRKNAQRRSHGFVGFRGIEIINAARGKVMPDQVEKFYGEKRGRMITQMISSVCDDQIVLSCGMRGDPTPPRCK